MQADGLSVGGRSPPPKTQNTLSRSGNRMIAQMDIAVREQRATSAQREAQRATLEAHSAIDLANRTREEFLARMSHELRTPLNAVIGFSRVLESNRAGNQRPEDIELLKRVRAGGEKLL